MSTASQFFGGAGGGSGGVPVGAFVDLPESAPNVFVDGKQTFLRSGVTDVSATYPSVSQSLLGPIYAQEPFVPEVSSHTSSGFVGDSFSMATNGTSTLIGFPRTPGTNLKYWISTDSGVTWKYYPLPGVSTTASESNGNHTRCAGIFYLNSSFIYCNGNGDVYTSPNGVDWTIRASIGAKLFRLANNRIFAMDNNDTSATFIKFSTDGITWPTISIGVAGAWQDVAHNGSNYILIARNIFTVYRCVASGDPTSTWVASTTNPSGGAYSFAYLASAISDGTAFHIISYGDVYNNGYSSSYVQYAHRSTDGGVVWTTTLLGTQSVLNAVNTGTYAEPRLVKIGNNLHAMYYNGYTTYTSANAGVSWSLEANTIAACPVYQNGNTLSTVKLGSSYFQIGTMRTVSTMVAAFSHSQPFASTANPATMLQQTNTLLAPTYVHEDKAIPGNIAVFLDGPGRTRQSQYGSNQELTNTNMLVTGNGSSVSSISALTDEFWYFTAASTRDGLGSWTRRRLPYFGAWKVAGYGKNNVFYVYSSYSCGNTTSIHWPTTSTLSADRRIYKTTDFVNWTRCADVPSGYDMVGLCENQTTTTLFLVGGTNLYSASLSLDGNTISTPVYIYSLGNTGGSTISRPSYVTSSGNIYISGNDSAVLRYLIKSGNSGLSWSVVSGQGISVPITDLVTDTTNGDVFLIDGSTPGTISVRQLRNDALRKSYSLTTTGSTANNSRAHFDPVNKKLYIRGYGSLFVANTNVIGDLVFNEYSAITGGVSGTSFVSSNNPITSKNSPINWFNDFIVVDGVAYSACTSGLNRSTPGKYIQNYKYISSVAGTTKYMRVA